MGGCQRAFVGGHDPNQKGNVAELAIAAEATRLGVDVSRPMGEHTRYDLIFGVARRLLRVQCKWAALKSDVIHVRLVSSRRTSTGDEIRRPYTADEIDAFGIYCEELDRCYLVPVDKIPGNSSLYLRVGEPRNGQKASLNWASDFELPGAVAQLGERSAGSRKVGGSNPPSSTQLCAEQVGAHAFRQMFGWYMQRAAAGEQFLVTRRGKPYVRLTPAAEQARLTPPAASG